MEAQGEAGAARASGGLVPALDGLRGVAILMVMLYHVNRLQGATAVDVAVSRVLHAGWSGVDVFFALSGFLITRGLLESRGRPRYFVNFYARRFLRIFPLYYAFLFALFVLVPLVLSPRGTEFARLQAHQGWFWAYLTNVLIARDGSWAGTPLNTGHLWSLAVEEQFYLAWPVVVLLLGRRALAAVCLACLPAAWLVRIVMLASGMDPVAGYVLTPARMDALALGALVAVSALEPGLAAFLRRWSGPFVLGALATIALVFAWTGGFSQTDLVTQALGYPALAILAAGLVLRVSDGQGGIGARVLGLAPLRALGRYSYAIYLFHDPVNLATERWLFTVGAVPRLFGSELPGQLAFGLGSSAISLVLALVSWHALEKHFLALKSRYAS